MSTSIHDISAELLKIWNDREATLVSEEGTALEKTLCGEDTFLVELCYACKTF